MSEATKFGHQIVALADPTTGIPYSATGGGGGGGAVTVADGADVAEGAKADAAWDGVAASASAIAILKKIATSGAAAGLTDTQLRASAVPMSLASVPTHGVTGTFWQATQPVSGTFWQATQPVSGAFFQATQPVSIAATVTVTGPLTDTQLRATAVPVSGSFFQATQPVSLAASVAVTGTFWQATQPVSLASTTITGSVAVTGPLTDTQLRATAVPVSGTFWQATQPVSGTFWQATQPISAAALPLPAGAATEASLALQQISTGTAVGTLKHQLAGAQANASAPTWTEATHNPLSQTLAGALRVGGTVTAAQGAAGTAAAAWFAKITDGTNVGAVKAASTAAVAADPAVVVALSPNQNTQANALFTRPRQVATYSATYRLAVAAAGATGLNLVHVVNTDKQIATIYHLVGSTKTVRIRLIRLQFSFEAAGVIEAEVQRLSATTAPATGNPAITPGKFDTSDAAAEATCLALPTTQGSLLAADQPVSPRYIWNAAVSAASAEMGRFAADIILYDSRQDSSGKGIALRAGVAEGIAIVTRSSVVGANTVTAYIEFTEE